MFTKPKADKIDVFKAAGDVPPLKVLSSNQDLMLPRSCLLMLKAIRPEANTMRLQHNGSILNFSEPVSKVSAPRYRTTSETSIDTKV